jgi:hypothetical protein
MMHGMARLGGRGLFVFLCVVLLSAVTAPGLLAQTTEIGGRVTGVNTVNDPPTLTVTTESGTGYLVRAPSVASIATAGIGSRFLARGAVANGVFVATSIEIFPEGATAPARPLAAAARGQATTIVGVIVGLDTEQDQPRLALDTGSGKTLIVILPGPSRVSDLQIGASINLTGTFEGDEFKATGFAVLSRPDGGHSNNESHHGDNDNRDRADNDNGDDSDNRDSDSDNSNDNGSNDNGSNDNGNSADNDNHDSNDNGHNDNH